MPYVTSIERLARKEGLEEGREAGREEACHALRQEIVEKYSIRWGQPPEQMVEKLEKVHHLKRLVGLLGSLATAKSPEEWPAP